MDPRRRSALILVLLTAATGLVQILWGERFFLGEGLGWDGQHYAELAARFPDILWERSQSPYRLGRLLPSVLVHYGLSLPGLPMKASNIVLGFLVLNAACLVLSAWLWTRIASRLDLSERGLWFGYIGLFCGHGMLKILYYSPVMTDATIIALSLAMVDAWLADRPARLLVVVALGAWTWPTMLVLGSLLYLFPRRTLPEGPPVPAAAWSAAATLAFLAGGAVVILILRYPGDYFAQASPIRLALLPLNAVLVAGFFYAALKTLLDTPELRWRSLASSLKSARLLVPLVLAAASVAFMLGLGRQEPSWALASLQDALSRPFRLPLISFVGHVVYLGPIMLVLALRWKEFCGVVHSYGPGMVLFMTGGLLLALGPDSRQLYNVFPVAVVLLAQVIDRSKPAVSAIAVFAAITLISSKVWYPINRGEFPPYQVETCMEFPWQRLFMNNGASMSPWMYAVQAPLVAIAGVILARLLRPPGTVRGMGELQ